MYQKNMRIRQICNYTLVEIDYPFGAQERLLICAAAERRLQRDPEAEKSATLRVQKDPKDELLHEIHAYPSQRYGDRERVCLL